MPQFSYTVINKENKQLSGNINAPDEKAARSELNALGFSILAIVASTGENPVVPAEFDATNIEKYEFSAIDKNGKKVVGTIQGEEIFSVYKRLVYEYQFDVQALYPANLSDGEKEKSIVKGIDYLKDRLLEEEMLAQSQAQKQQMDEKEFKEKQLKLKSQIEFVLIKMNQIIDNYKEELDPATKAKLKYYIEKILRIKNSTNLDYIRQTCEEMLTYLQKEEIFLNKEQRLKEKTQLSIEAKSMMIQLSKASQTGGEDIFDLMRSWRDEHMINNNEPSLEDKLINTFFSLFIGPEPEPQEVIAAREKVRRINTQIKEYLTIYFQAPDPEFKKETKESIKRLWTQRKLQKRELAKIIAKLHAQKMENIEFTSTEILQREIFGLAGWILTFYIIYYFVTIYLNSKQINFIPQTRLNLIFQTSMIKYFFTTLFLLVCFLGIKIEFFKRKHYINPVLIVLFLLSSSLIILNF
jgi:hypothetical protein